VTVTEFRRRYGISAVRWRAMIEAGSTPRIHHGPRKRSEITENAAKVWEREEAERLERWAAPCVAASEQPG
jgi:hypothetical protein